MTVVKHFNVINYILFRGFSRLINSLICPLRFETTEESFDYRVISAISLLAHAADHCVFLQLVLIVVARILTSPI